MVLIVDKIIKVDKTVVNDLSQHAIKGYMAKGKRECLGLLFGAIEKRTADKQNSDGTIRIKNSYPYKFGKRTRIDWNTQALKRRTKQLEKGTDLQCLGLYHSHVEVKNKITCGLCLDDWKSFLGMPYPIELLVCAWKVGFLKSKPLSGPMGHKGKKAVYHNNCDMMVYYRYIVKGFLKTKEGAEEVEVKVV